MNKAAQALGRLAKGVPKNYTTEERKRRATWMRLLNDKRKDGKYNEARSNGMGNT